MIFLVIFGCIILLCALASPLYGEIYSWTDAKGIMQFTKYHPPPQAKLFIKDVRPPRPEPEVSQKINVDAEQPTAKKREIPEYVDEKLEETIRRIDDFERNLEDAEILNLGLQRKLMEANQKADAALAYAEDLEYKVRESATLPNSNTLYRNAFYRYPTRYMYRRPVKIHKSRIRHKRFYIKRHSIERHFKKSPNRSHHKTLTGRTHFSIPHSGGIHQKGHLGSRHISKRHSVGIQHKRHLGSRHVSKSRGIGVRSNARFGHRNIRR